MTDEYYNQPSQTQRIPQQRPAQQQYQQPYQAQQYQYQQPQYQQPQYQPQYQQPVSMPPQNVTSTGSWVLTLFLMCIPIVNIVLLFVWAFGSNTEASKQNWARANLVWILIGIIATVAFFGIMAAMGISLDQMQRV